MDKLFIEDLDYKDKKILMRVDFNVPLDNDLNVIDATKIEEALPSINYVLKQGGTLILMSHLGRPRHAYKDSLSLAPLAKVLSGLLNRPVKMAKNCVGEDVKSQVANLKKGEILLLENLRFHRAEEFPDEAPEFAKELSSYGDIYINDAFGSSHRKHSSIYTITNYFPGRAAAGYLLAKEIRFLSQMLNQPEKPFYTLIGGSKVSTKINILRALLPKVDALLIGGAMAFTFLKAQGKEVGQSLVENDLLDEAKKILQEAPGKILLPVDLVVAKECSSTAKTRLSDVDQGLLKDEQGFDIGPKTRSLFASKLKNAKTILWNGPVGVYEIEQFGKGTEACAEAIANSKAFSIVGGGDSIAAINALDLRDQITHLSTGGGATLEFIEHGTLPGIEALSEPVKIK